MEPSKKLKTRLLKMIAGGVRVKHIADASGVDRCTLHSWLYKDKPRGISVTAFDKLCELLGYELRPIRKPNNKERFHGMD